MIDLDKESDGVEFIDEGPDIGKDLEREKHYSFVIRFLLKKGYAKTELQANLIVVIITIIAFSLSLYFFNKSTEYGTLQKPTVSVEVNNSGSRTSTSTPIKNSQ